MEEEFIQDNLFLFRRKLSSVEHMVLVTYKYTRNSEILFKIIEAIVETYEEFFNVAYLELFGENEDEFIQKNLLYKMKVIDEEFKNRTHRSPNLKDYLFLKKLLLNEFESVGEFRKNLALIFYLEDEEYEITISNLKDFLFNLKEAHMALVQKERVY